MVDGFGSSRDRSFETTHWSMVLRAADGSSEDANQALADLCQSYWWPLYAYVRSRVGDAHQAQDLTQTFFASLLEKNFLGSVDPNKGRFRGFLLTAMKRLMANEWEKQQALKRGGGVRVISFDLLGGEQRYRREPSDGLSPDQLFQRNWARTLIDQVFERLQCEYSDAGKAEAFARLRIFITPGERQSSMAEVANQLGITEAAARVAAHRLRRRYRAIMRSEVAKTVADPADVDAEIGELFAAFQ